MQKVKDFEDRPDGLEKPLKCECGKWFEEAHGHKLWGRLGCRECGKEFQEMLERSKGIKVPK